MKSFRSRSGLAIVSLLVVMPATVMCSAPEAGPGARDGSTVQQASSLGRPQRQVTSRLVRLGPGNWRLSGRVRGDGSRTRVLLQRRTCPECDWTKTSGSRTSGSGRYRFTVEAPGRARVHYRVWVPGDGRYRAVGTRARAFAPLAVNLDDSPPGWGKPSWRDEFNRGSVDRDKWRVHHHSYVSYDIASHDRRQARTRDGKLVLRAQRVDPSKDPFNRAWRSAYLDTRGGRFSQRFGRFEILAKVPTTTGNSRGLWPSFWLRDDQGVGEIDVMETWGTPTSRPHEERSGNYTWTVHSDTQGGGTEKGGWGRPSRAAPIARGFHRYTAVWTPDEIRFLFDGKVVGRVDRQKHPWLTTSFPSSLNLRLQFAVGSSYWGLPTDVTKSPADYVIEYVRVWKLPVR